MIDENSRRHYFDWAATAPPFDMPDRISAFGNPSSIHLEGRKARDALEDARSRCAAVLDVKPENIFFTSGGTESNNLILYSLLRKKNRSRVLFTAVEHPSIRENCYALEHFGISAAAIPVGKDGRASPEAMGYSLQKYPDARFAAVMSVNNETGAVMDMKSIAAVIRGKTGAPVHIHCDMVQAAGKIHVDLPGWDIDSASISAHKLGGPGGTGLLYLRKPIEPLFEGSQERGMRPGTENIAAASAFADILEKLGTRDTIGKNSGPAGERFARLINSLKKTSRCSIIPEDRSEDDCRFSPWILQARFRGIPGEVMVRALDSEGFAISTGSACSASLKERPVLKAMGLDENSSLEGIRISQGWTTTMDDITALIAGIEKVLRFL